MNIIFLLFPIFVVFLADSNAKADSAAYPTDPKEPVESNLFDEGFLKRANIEVSRKKLRPQEYDILVQKLGILALYYRIYKEFVPTKDGRGFLHQYPNQKLEVPDDVANKCSDGIEECVNLALSHISQSHPWFYPKEAHGLDEIQLQREFLERTINDHTLEMDLTMGQVFCHLTMNENEAFKHLPFCRYKTSKNNEKPMVWFGRKYSNFQSPNRPFDALSIEPFECAKQSFCPDPCCRDINPNSLEFTGPKCRLNVCKNADKCYLKREFNGDFSSLRSNLWNISCPCSTGYIHRSDVEQCIHENKCGTETPCREDEDCLNSSTGEGYECLCQLGTVRDNHNHCVNYTYANIEWNGFALSEPHPSLAPPTFLWVTVAAMSLRWILL